MGYAYDRCQFTVRITNLALYHPICGNVPTSIRKFKFDLPSRSPIFPEGSAVAAASSQTPNNNH